MTELQEQIVVFTINDNYYGASISDVSEIINTTNLKIVDLPSKQKTYIDGVSNIRDKVYSIVNGYRLLNPEKEEQDLKNEKIVLLSEGQIGVLVDDVLEIVDTKDNKKHKITDIEMKGDYRFIDYLLEYNKQYVAILNLKEMLVPKKEDL